MRPPQQQQHAGVEGVGGGGGSIWNDISPTRIVVGVMVCTLIAMCVVDGGLIDGEREEFVHTRFTHYSRST